MERHSCAEKGFLVDYKTATYKFLYKGTKFQVTTFRCPACGATRTNEVIAIPDPYPATQHTINGMAAATDANLSYNQTRFPLNGGHGQPS